MNRNRLSRLTPCSVSSPVTLFGSLPRFSAVATLFHNPLALLGGLLLCLAPAAASGQGVTLQSGSHNLGSANVCPAGQTTPTACSNTVTLTYSVDAGTTIGSVAILTIGAPNLDFTLASGSTCTGSVTTG